MQLLGRGHEVAEGAEVQLVADGRWTFIHIA
jgi:hypothetical protein